MGSGDNLCGKVPHSNVTMRSGLMACNTLQCLILFHNASLHALDLQKSPKKINYGHHLSILKNLQGHDQQDWKVGYIKSVMGNLCGHLFDESLKLNLFKNMNFLKKTAMSFLFYIDITLNKGVCLIHEGAKIPGRGAKSATALVREFSRNGEQQYLVTHGEKTPKLIFKSKYFLFKV